MLDFLLHEGTCARLVFFRSFCCSYSHSRTRVNPWRAPLKECRQLCQVCSVGCPEFCQKTMRTFFFFWGGGGYLLHYDLDDWAQCKHHSMHVSVCVHMLVGLLFTVCIFTEDNRTASLTDQSSTGRQDTAPTSDHTSRSRNVTSCTALWPWSFGMDIHAGCSITCTNRGPCVGGEGGGGGGIDQEEGIIIWKDAVGSLLTDPGHPTSLHLVVAPVIEIDPRLIASWLCFLSTSSMSSPWQLQKWARQQRIGPSSYPSVTLVTSFHFLLLVIDLMKTIKNWWSHERMRIMTWMKLKMSSETKIVSSDLCSIT